MCVCVCVCVGGGGVLSAVELDSHELFPARGPQTRDA